MGGTLLVGTNVASHALFVIRTALVLEIMAAAKPRADEPDQRALTFARPLVMETRCVHHAIPPALSAARIRHVPIDVSSRARLALNLAPQDALTKGTAKCHVRHLVAFCLALFAVSKI